jgi:hypothetical protein
LKIAPTCWTACQIRIASVSSGISVSLARGNIFLFLMEERFA